MRALLVGCAALLVALGTAGPAVADPVAPSCFDPRLCGDLGAVTFCPGKGMVSAWTPCPSLVVGPYAPGGLRPNEGSEDR